MGRCGLKVQTWSCKRNPFWGSNVQCGDCSSDYSTVHLRFVQNRSYHCLTHTHTVTWGGGYANYLDFGNHSATRMHIKSPHRALLNINNYIHSLFLKKVGKKIKSAFQVFKKKWCYEHRVQRRLSCMAPVLVVWFPQPLCHVQVAKEPSSGPWSLKTGHSPIAFKPSIRIRWLWLQMSTLFLGPPPENPSWVSIFCVAVFLGTGASMPSLPFISQVLQILY